MAYQVCIIGTGYVGLVSGVTFAETGNNVICVDKDNEKIEKLRKGIPPIFEPGLDSYLKRNIREKRIHFTTELSEGVRDSLITFFCLPTPPNEDGSADLSQILKVAKDIALIFKQNNITEPRIIVNKSTVPVGTASKVRAIFDELFPNHQIEVASNPEFLREGFAIEDSMKPERVVIGTRSKFVEEVLRELYEPFVRSGNPIFVFDECTAEVVKYASNAFLATKISFMNDLSAFCEAVGADIEKVRIGMGSDSRIGKRFLFAGIGFGGSCFPKDVRALIRSAEDVGTPLTLVKATYEVNQKQIQRFIDKILRRFDNNVENRTFSVWGLAFKPNTDDVREAPAFNVIDSLLEKGAKVQVYDPEAMENTRKIYGEKIFYSKDMYSCLENAEALVIATEWTVFRTPNFKLMKSKMKDPIIFDGRNLYSFEEVEKYGFEYFPVGRSKI
ncbi:MAG: UDP-glucose dehydrogenase family protein [Candidatus Kapaibacteriales bacterium]